MEKEIWKEVKGYEGIYEVSDLGNVKSLPREMNRGSGITISKERILKPYVYSRGYYGVSLRKDNKAKTKKVHQLVAIAFLNHTPDGTQKLVVDHIDNNKLNNRLDNLQLTTNRENSSKDRKGGSSKFIGVSWDRKYNKWKAQIRINGKKVHLGYFKIEIEASNAYNNKLKEII